MADARPRHVLHVMATRMDFRSPASFMDRKKNFFFSNPLFKNRPICFAFRRARFVLEKEGAKREWDVKRNWASYGFYLYEFG